MNATPCINVYFIHIGMRAIVPRIFFARVLVHVLASWCVGASSRTLPKERTLFLKPQRTTILDEDPLLLLREPPKGACGDWQGNYAKLHAQDQQKARGRYMFHQCDEGQADCLAGMVSAFYLSVLSGRAFFTGKYSYQYFFGGEISGHLSAAFEKPFINWELPPSSFQARFHDSEQFMLQGLHSGHLSSRKIKRIYDAVMGGQDTVTIFSNAGILHRLFEIPRFRKQMVEGLGVSLENAFGCALDFLFWPKNDFHYTLKNEEILRRAIFKGRPVIGLHLRSGDAVFKTGTGVVNDASGVNQTFHGAIACVEEIQKRVIAQHGTPAVLLVLSDDMLVRRSMADIFPKYDVVYNDVSRPEHTGPFQGSGVTVHGLQTAAIEFWLFGISDFQVTWKLSGFGRAASVRTLPSKPTNIYVLEDYARSQSCGPTDQVPFMDVAKILPGI